MYKNASYSLHSCDTNSVDAADTRKAVDQMEGFLKSVDQNVDQAPQKEKRG